MRYVGSASAANDNLYHKNTPKTVPVSIHVSSGSKGAARYSDEKMTSFSVKLNSQIYVEEKCRDGVHLNKDKRSRVIRVVSLSDFQVDSPLKSTELIVKKSRENLDSNHFNITVSVPVGHNAPFAATLVLRSATNDATVSVPIRFSPSQPAQKSKAPKVAAPAAQEEQTQPTYDIDTKARDVSKAEEKGSQGTQWLVALFVLVLGLMALCSSDGMVSYLIIPNT